MTAAVLVAFVVYRSANAPLQEGSGRIEALEVSYLKDALVFGGTCNQRASLLGRLGDRLFNQHMRARGQERIGDLEMRWRGSDHADRVDLLELVWSNLLRIYERDAALEWLFGVNPLLGDRRPIDLIRMGRTEELMRAIRAERSDTFA